MIARTAGIESSANATSVVSITISTMKSGVASHLPFCFVKKWPVSRSSDTGKNLRKRWTTGFFSGWTFS
ncbi:hypothetical protein D3C83_35770 [compost metagenome]